ncbi:protein translocase subunit [Neofusicoccum ribis]|uniref:Mitochondrial import inner membrane translocase subunit n=1 Tax=Neofusicoccum ribis TaxID=45134 RepID=A0ABR3SNQ7_9PEZI
MDSFNITSSDPKTAVMQQKLNEHCFERCVPKPGTSLSKGEETCFTQCMEKYMSAWNVVSRQYVAKLQQTSGGNISL